MKNIFGIKMFHPFRVIAPAGALVPGAMPLAMLPEAFSLPFAHCARIAATEAESLTHHNLGHHTKSGYCQYHKLKACYIITWGSAPGHKGQSPCSD